MASGNDEQLKILTECMRIKISGLAGWDHLGHLSIRIGESNKTEEIYRILYDSISATDTEQLYILYHQLWIYQR